MFNDPIKQEIIVLHKNLRNYFAPMQILKIYQKIVCFFLECCKPNYADGAFLNYARVYNRLWKRRDIYLQLINFRRLCE
jgi:hypothetical protein